MVFLRRWDDIRWSYCWWPFYEEITFPVKKAGAAYFSAAIDLLSPSCHFFCLVVSSIFVNMELNLGSKIPLLPVNFILGDLHPTNVSCLVFSQHISASFFIYKASLFIKKLQCTTFIFPHTHSIIHTVNGTVTGPSLVWNIHYPTTIWPSAPYFTATPTILMGYFQIYWTKIASNG